MDVGFQGRAAHHHHVEPCAGREPLHFRERHLGQCKHMVDGRVSFAYSRFFGLDKDKETGKIVVNPEQAETALGYGRMSFFRYRIKKMA